ncbi:unnamed protein product [Symbiodinium microadriaticum]|nr:unnamed protein product [Symbiodinium microadriaticum]
MQVFLLHSVSSKLCVPAVRQVRRVYDEFQVAIYGENTYITVNGFHRGKAGAEPDLAGFRALSMEKKVEICSVPLSQPYFTYTILLIWTVTCLAEIRRAVRLLFSTLLSVPTVLVVEDVLKEKTITGMTRGMKAFIGVFCFLPRIAAAMLLNYLGCRWLLSTANLQDLFLNSLALEFMVVLPELLYNTFATDRGKRLTEETMLTAGEKAAVPLKGSIKSLLLSLTWVVFAVAWVYVYMVYVQSVLPGLELFVMIPINVGVPINIGCGPSSKCPAVKALRCEYAFKAKRSIPEDDITGDLDTASANAVFGHVEAEAERRAKEKRHETDARDDQADRMKSEMQGMMRMQQQGMEMIIGNRGDEAEAKEDKEKKSKKHKKRSLSQ